MGVRGSVGSAGTAPSSLSSARVQAKLSGAATRLKQPSLHWTKTGREEVVAAWAQLEAIQPQHRSSLPDPGKALQLHGLDPGCELYVASSYYR